MSRQQWLSIIGVWIMVFLYLGFPIFWDKIFAICTGLLIIFISFKLRPRTVSKDSAYPLHSGQRQSAYVENGGHSVGE